jgi:hypothetical protein
MGLAFNRKILFILLFLIVCLPSIVMIQFGQSSLAMGTVIGQIIILVILFFNRTNALFRKSHLKYFFLITGFFVIHTIVVILITNRFDFIRSLGSYFVLTLIYFSSTFFVTFIYSNIIYLNNILIYLFIVFYSFGCLSIFFGTNVLPSYDTLNRGIFPFFEPSHFILSISPFLFYFFISEVKKVFKFFVLIISFAFLFYVNNLTMLLILSSSAFFLFRKKSQTIFLFIFVSIGVFLIFNLNSEYYTSRIDTSNDDNLSTLVWLQGWENAFINIKETYGLGVGFQQFGVNGLKGSATEAIAYLRSGDENQTLNQLDGGTLGAKILGEFGVFGMIFILFLFYKSFTSFIKLRKMIYNHSSSLYIFSLCVYSVFLFELFVRSMSYISNNIVLLFLVFLIPSKFLINKNE